MQYMPLVPTLGFIWQEYVHHMVFVNYPSCLIEFANIIYVNRVTG